MCAAIATEALQLIEEDATLLARLRANIATFRETAARAGLAITPSSTAIQPLLLGDAQAAVDASARLLERGFLVPAIRPPTVPEGTSRLRISLSAAHEAGEIEALVGALSQACAP